MYPRADDEDVAAAECRCGIHVLVSQGLEEFGKGDLVRGRGVDGLVFGLRPGVLVN
jgi:hypothetical protein